MFRKSFLFAGPLLLAGAAVCLMPGQSHAQRGGGHGGGAGHFGGGGAHFAGGGTHFSGAHYGGYGAGAYRGGARINGSHYGYGRYRPYYGGYGFYPYYGGSYPNYYDTTAPSYDSTYSGYYGATPPDLGYGANSAASSASDYQAFYPSSTATSEPDTTAHLTVKVPADAQLWFNGTPTTSTGTLREFNSPPLAAGKHLYDVQARWVENGREMMEAREVEVTPGSHVSVGFPAPPETASHMSTVKKG